MSTLSYFAMRPQFIHKRAPYRRTTASAEFYALLLSTALLCGCALIADGVSLNSFLICAIAITALLPLLLRAASGRFDVIEPITISSIALMAMFVIRPTGVLFEGLQPHVGLDVSEHYTGALAVALAGTFAFEAGYSSRFGQILAAHIHSVDEPRLDRFPVVSLILFIVGLGGFGIFIFTTGGMATLSSLAHGRGAGNDQIFRNSTGYLYDAVNFLIPASTISWVRSCLPRAKYDRLLSWIYLIPVLLYQVSRGTRSDLIFLSAIPISWYLLRRKRPNLMNMLLIGIALAFVLAVLREHRNIETRTDQNLAAATLDMLKDPLPAVYQVVGSDDDDMFDSLANELAIVPDTLHHRPGASLLDIVIRAVPRVVYRDKPIETNDLITSTLWPAHYSKSRASPALSLLGPFYLDSGVFGVIVGMFSIGVTLSLLWNWLQRNMTNAFVIIFYALSVPMIVVLFRGFLSDTIARSFFLVFPALFLIYPKRSSHKSKIRICTIHSQNFRRQEP